MKIDLLLPTSHARPASMGDVSWSMSLPYKQSPASKRNESRAPKPPNCTLACVEFNSASTMIDALSPGIEISTPSSPGNIELKFIFKNRNEKRKQNDDEHHHQPVYPHRVTRQSGTPAIFCDVVRIKYKSRNECDESSSSAATAFGPCTAIRARASLSRNSTVTSFPCLLNRSYKMQSNTINFWKTIHTETKTHECWSVMRCRFVFQLVILFGSLS